MNPMKAILLACLLLAGPASAGSVLQIHLAANDLVYDPLSRKIYASVPGIVGSYGNSVIAIDPERGALGTPLYVGSEPGKLALSADGRYLYVALNGAAAVRRVDLRAQRAELQFPLGQDPQDSPFFAGDMEVAPGHPESLAVARHYSFLGTSFGGVAIYDDGVPRPKTTKSSPQSREIEFAASFSRIYGLDDYSNPVSFDRLLVDGAGVSFVDQNWNIGPFFHPRELPINQDLNQYIQDMKFDSGRVYLSTGDVIDPEAMSIVGTFPAIPRPALVRPDASVGRVFFVAGTSQAPDRVLMAFDLASMKLVGTMPVLGVTGRASSLIRWGIDGLAFRTDADQIFLLRTSLVPGAALPLSCSPSAVVGGTASTGLVTLRRRADVSTQVQLTSSVPSAATVPAVVTIPVGATSASFPITTTPVATDKRVTLSATAGGVAGTAALKVLAPSLISVAVNPARVNVGGSAVGTVALTGPAPVGGQVIRLTLSPRTGVAVPSSVTVPAGRTTAAFSLTAGTVDVETAYSLTADSAGVTATTGLRVLPPALRSLIVQPEIIPAGSSATGTVSLVSPAPLGGVTVLLSVDRSGITVPEKVFVPAGATTATFTVKTSPDVAVDFPTVSAYLRPNTRSARLEVRGVELLSVALYSASARGGATVTGVVIMAGPAPTGDLFVRLTSDDPTGAQVPDSVKVVKGATRATFPVTTTPVSAARLVALTAATTSASRTTSLSVLPPAVAASLSLDPPTLTGGGSGAGIVTLTGPAPAAGVVVSLASADAQIAELPNSITVPACGTTVRFPITTHSVSALSPVPITAAAGGVRRMATLQVQSFK